MGLPGSILFKKETIKTARQVEPQHGMRDALPPSNIWNAKGFVQRMPLFQLNVP